MCDNSILNKIKHLLNKTVENGCTEAEALSALTTARKLMLKHKLEEKDILKEDDKEIVKMELNNYNTTIPWIYMLIDVFTKNFGVLKYITTRGKIHRVTLFGFKTDVECVIEIINCAYEIAEEKAEKYAREYRDIFGTAKGIKYSWFNGFVAGIQAKYEEQNKQEKYALMIQVDKEVQTNFSNFTKDFVQKERVIKNKSTSAHAELNGYTEGKRFGTTAIKEG